MNEVAIKDLQYGDIVVDDDESAEVHYVRTWKDSDKVTVELVIVEGDRLGRGVSFTLNGDETVTVSRRGPGRERLDLGEWWPDGYKPKKRKRKK